MFEKHANQFGGRQSVVSGADIVQGCSAQPIGQIWIQPVSQKSFRHSCHMVEVGFASGQDSEHRVFSSVRTFQTSLRERWSSDSDRDIFSIH